MAETAATTTAERKNTTLKQIPTEINEKDTVESAAVILCVCKCVCVSLCVCVCERERKRKMGETNRLNDMLDILERLASPAC